jgi:biopolymer transport protein ExbD
MAAPVRMTAGIGITLILLGIGLPAGYQRWMDTRTFIPLDQPVSLSPGRIKTADFSVNLRGWYEIGVDLDNGFGYRPGCGFGGLDPLLKTRSIVYKNGNAVEHINGADRFLGHFYAEKSTRYSLDIEVLTEASCLNGGHPRIFVWTSSAEYQRLLGELALSVGLVLPGLGLLIFSIAGHLRPANGQQGLAISGPVGYAYYPARRKPPLRARFARPPSFGLVYAVILLSVLMPGALIFVCQWGFDHRSVGIRVHVLKSRPLRTADNSSTPRPIVRIEQAGQHLRPHLYLNSKVVAWETLDGALMDDLKSRPELVVYVKAEPEVSWADVLNVMDIIRGQLAEVVLLTARTSARKRTAIMP